MGLDDVRVERPLHQEAGVRAEFAGGALEDADEGLADDAALAFGVGDAVEGTEELVRGRLGHHQSDPHVFAEGALDALALVHPHEPGVHEDAGQLVAHRTVHQRRRHRRVHAAREPADHLRVAHLLTDPLHRFGHEGPRSPVGPAAADAEEEVLDDLPAARGVRDLGVELDAVEGAGAGAEGRDGKVGGGGEGHEAGGRLVDVVAVRAPDGDVVAGVEAVEEVGGVSGAGVRRRVRRSAGWRGRTRACRGAPRRPRAGR